MEPWEIYLDELRRRAGPLPDRTFGRAELLANAAHDAYEASTNRLTECGWDGEQALTVTRIFGQAVKQWIERNGSEWDALREELRHRYTAWMGERQAPRE